MAANVANLGIGNTATPILLKESGGVSSGIQTLDISDSDLQEWSNKYVFLLFEVRYVGTYSGMYMDSTITK